MATFPQKGTSRQLCFSFDSWAISLSSSRHSECTCETRGQASLGNRVGRFPEAVDGELGEQGKSPGLPRLLPNRKRTGVPQARSPLGVVDATGSWTQRKWQHPLLTAPGSESANERKYF
jgi:hypothetical protein